MTRPRTSSLLSRLLPRVDQSAGPDGCWPWTGRMNKVGYGAIKVGRVPINAHRAMWLAVNGPVLADLFVCHTCDNRRCVNPAHLFLGTHAENMADMVAKGRQSRGASAIHTARLTTAEVAEIRGAEGTTRSLAKQFGVAQATIWRIRAGQAWVHLLPQAER